MMICKTCQHVHLYHGIEKKSPFEEGHKEKSRGEYMLCNRLNYSRCTSPKTGSTLEPGMHDEILAVIFGMANVKGVEL